MADRHFDSGFLIELLDRVLRGSGIRCRGKLIIAKLRSDRIDHSQIEESKR